MTLDAIADADPALEAGRHPQPRTAWKRAGGPDHRFIFKNDRAASARDADASAANPGNATRCDAAMATRGSGNIQAMRGGGAVIAGPYVSDSRFRPRRDRMGGASPTEIPR